MTEFWEMGPQIVLAVGGLGLFLLGMTVLTEGLHGLAGNALRRVLRRFTNSPLSGAVTGAGVTAVVQSSSATTVAAVGFVGAGLMTFPQALGIIFGANIGTTMTGWIVAIVGFKLQLGQVVLPLVLVGALMRMFGEGRTRHIGTALAGFSLLFVGIDAMQDGMAPFQGAVTPDSFPQDTWIGRLQLMLIGILITLITQSSSAGVVTALVALGAGAISFPQAAAMVIGMDVGTTATTALATLGGSTATKRTGYSHVIYNCMTGIMALLVLSPYVALVDGWFNLADPGDAQVALVAFHSGFNILGVILIIGFTTPFARMICAIVPDEGAQITERLDRHLLKEPAAAVDAVAATLREITDETAEVIVDLLRLTGEAVPCARLTAIEQALAATQDYADQIKIPADQEMARRRHSSALHALDHLNRLLQRCLQADRIALIRQTPALSESARRLVELLDVKFVKEETAPEFTQHINTLRKDYRDHRKTFRAETVKLASRGELDSEATMDRMDSVRWLHRVAYHLWRITYHMDRAAMQAPEEIRPQELDGDADID